MKLALIYISQLDKYFIESPWLSAILCLPRTFPRSQLLSEKRSKSHGEDFGVLWASHMRQKQVALADTIITRPSDEKASATQPLSDKGKSGWLAT